MRNRIDPTQNVSQVPGRIDDEGRPLERHLSLTGNLALAPHAVGLAHPAICVGEERYFQIVFGDKIIVAGQVVAADAEESGVELLERRLLITEAAGLKRSARGIVHGVEEEDDILPLQIGEPDGFACWRRRQLEVRGWRPRPQYLRHVLSLHG
jgi:hypothetical protein